MPDSAAGDLQKKLKDISRDAEERDAERRAHKLGLSYTDLRKIPVSIAALKLVSEADAKAAELVPVQLGTKEVAVAVFDPELPEAKRVVKELTDKQLTVKLFAASRSGIEEAWHSYTFIAPETQSITGKVSIESAASKLTTIEAIVKEIAAADFTSITTSQLLELLLGGALATRASDIHFEAEEKGVRLRYRIDGVLHDLAAALPLRNYANLLSRIKLVSGMKINVHGEAQDGRFTITLREKDIEMRVSIIPSEFGETIVMRILDPGAINVELGELGLRPDDLVIVEKALKKPNGLILNTGPTGSGKTTTLYAFLRKLTNSEIKTITVEDPVEYHIKGIEQTQVDAEAGYTFAKGLRAIVRQDPDVILVGEIRDFETADIALEAALTGHLVLSTLHTNDAVGAVPRLLDLGVKPETIGPALSLVIAQRLVRKLCEKCRKAVPIPPDLAAKIATFLEKLPARVDRTPFKTETTYEALGCEACNSFGYKGRRGIFEFFVGGPELETIILEKVSEVPLRELAKREGMVTMQEDGILKVLQGTTTFEEVESVTGPIEW